MSLYNVMGIVVWWKKLIFEGLGVQMTPQTADTMLAKTMVDMYSS